MKQAWISVMSELTTFLLGEVRRLFTGVTIHVNPVVTPARLQSLTPFQLMAPVLPAPLHSVSVEAVLFDTSLLYESVVMYVSVPAAVCYLNPHDDFDGGITSFPYGTAVTVVSFAGRYAHVQRQNVVGYILKDELVQDKKSVWPILKDGEQYQSDHEYLRLIRLVLGDEFRAGVLKLPLQSGEYVLYRLRLDNRRIDWPMTRPRVPGMWQKVLRGQPLVHIGVSPKTDSIMEWYDGQSEGQLAYIEKVLTDNSLVITTVGQAGVFQMRTLSPDVWREYRPVFMEIS